MDIEISPTTIVYRTIHGFLLTIMALYTYVDEVTWPSEERTRLLALIERVSKELMTACDELDEDGTAGIIPAFYSTNNETPER